MILDPYVEQAIRKMGSVPEAADKLGVSKSLLYMVLRGDRQPSDDLLKKLGLVRVVMVTRGGQE